MNVIVIGAGTMGNGIVHIFAQAGHSVTIVDISQDALQKGISTIDSNLSRQVKKELISEESKNQTLSHITVSTDLLTAVKNADLLVEAASENKSIKIQLFQEAQKSAPESCIFASNTSSISITELAAATNRPDKFIGMHFFNPVPIMKLCEIVRGFATSDDTYSTIYSLSKELGKVPVTVQDYPGFISNRILMPMINEAIYCLMEGVASAEDIDTVMKLGMAHPMGPLTLADFIGLDICLSIMEVLCNGYADSKYRPCPLLKKMVAAGHLGRKSGKGFFTYSV
jgi:3-hydroxybutyryl-CoA dehydrogenase